MIRTDPKQTEFVDFYLPFNGGLTASNRWIKLAALMPWSEVESHYSESLSSSGMGAPALSGRIAYGSLFIRERMGLTDEETTEQIGENPYLQYFLGLSEFHDGPLFDSSMMVHFRKRFSSEAHRQINEKMIAEATGSKLETENKAKGSDGSDDDPPPNSGKLLVDATCTPADIKHPTDLSLLNDAREKTESVIDSFHSILRLKDPSRRKERTYRQEARGRYLAVAKQKKPGKKKIRKAIGQQLRYLKRNLGHIDRMLDQSPSLLKTLSAASYKKLLVIRALYAQQLEMYEARKQSVADRIVSISQPHVRPIVRGKAGKNTEFGAKISISHQKEGFVTLDTISWDAYNEGTELQEQIQAYRRRFGYYPESVHADKIYRTAANRKYCKEHNIRLSGRRPGRPKKETADNRQQLKAERQQLRQDEIDRIPVEGKFGNGKRKGTIGRIMAKLAHTSESVIHIAILVLNLEQRLRLLLLAFLGHAGTLLVCPLYQFRSNNSGQWPTTERYKLIFSDRTDSKSNLLAIA